MLRSVSSTSHKDTIWLNIRRGWLFMEWVTVLDKRYGYKRFTTYCRCIWIKHMQLGSSVMRQLCKCVQGLILISFPVKKGDMKRDYKQLKHCSINGGDMG